MKKQKCIAHLNSIVAFNIIEELESKVFQIQANTFHFNSNNKAFERSNSFINPLNEIEDYKKDFWEIVLVESLISPLTKKKEVYILLSCKNKEKLICLALYKLENLYDFKTVFIINKQNQSILNQVTNLIEPLGLVLLKNETILFLTSNLVIGFIYKEKQLLSDEHVILIKLQKAFLVSKSLNGKNNSVNINGYSINESSVDFHQQAQWFELSIEVNDEKMKLNVCCRPVTNILKSISCPIQCFWSDKDRIITSTNKEVILANHKKILKCCQIKVSEIDEIFSGGAPNSSFYLFYDLHQHQIAIYSDWTSFKLIKIIKNVEAVVSGCFVIDTSIKKAFIILHNLTDFNEATIIDKTSFTMISSLDDLSSNRPENSEDFYQSEDIDDLFNEVFLEKSAVNESTESLNKVQTCLQNTIKKQTAYCCHLKNTLKQMKSFSKNTQQKIEETKNIFHVDEKDTKSCESFNSSNIDLFTGIPIKVEKDENFEKIFVMIEKWKRNFKDEIIFGFQMKNISKKKFHKFCVILQPKDNYLEQIDVKSKYFLSEDLKNQDLLKMKNNFTKISSNDKVDVICSINWKWKRSNVGFKVIVSALEVESSDDPFYFHLGEVFIESTEVAFGSIYLNLSEFDFPYKDICCLLTSYSHQCYYQLKSTSFDIHLIFKNFVEKIGFEKHESLGCLLCKNQGNLYFNLLQVFEDSRRKLSFTLATKSPSEEEFFLSCLYQSLPADVIVEKIKDEERARKIEEEEMQLKDLEKKMNEYKVVETFESFIKKNQHFVVLAVDKKPDDNYENLLKESLKIQIQLNEVELMND